MPRLTVQPFERVIEAAPGETVFAAAHREGLLIPTACAGKGTCGLCRVKVLAGQETLPPVSRVEEKHLGNTYFITKLRLSCQLPLTGDVTVLVPDAPKRR